MKAVRTREENLDELKRRRKNLLGKADAAEKKLSKMSPEHKQLTMQTSLLYKLREDIRAMDSEIMTEEAALSDFKRQSAREWMGTKFGGLLECCEKGTVSASTSQSLHRAHFSKDRGGIWEAHHGCKCISLHSRSHH